MLRWPTRNTTAKNEISKPLSATTPPHTLFSLRSQTATSQLAGFRNILISTACFQCKAQLQHVATHKHTIRWVFWGFSENHGKTRHSTVNHDLSNPNCHQFMVKRTNKPRPWTSTRSCRAPTSQMNFLYTLEQFYVSSMHIYIYIYICKRMSYREISYLYMSLCTCNDLSSIYIYTHVFYIY